MRVCLYWRKSAETMPEMPRFQRSICADRRDGRRSKKWEVIFNLFMSKIITDENKIKELISRGVEEVIMRESLEKKLKSGRQLRVKFGIDPTAPDIHLGHSVVLRKLKQFQDLGHKAVLIIGDFTATIGDPSGRSETRKSLTQKEVRNNLKSYLAQAEKIIDIKKTEINYNSKWLAKLNGIKLLELLSLVSVQQMLERADFHKRFLEHQSIRINEFFYPIMQAYDSVIVKSDIEIGGTDQKFNILAGRDLMEKMGLPPQDIIMLSILEGTDGARKMSKSYGNYIGVADTPGEMFGKIMSLPDKLITKYFLLCTDQTGADIKNMENNMQSGKLNPRDAKSDLAFEIVKIYHGDRKAETARDEFINIFSEKKTPENAKPLKVGKNDITILELAEKSGLFKSRGEIKRIIEQGGVKIAGKTYKNWGEAVHLEGGEILQIGKKDFWGIEI